ncbi:unnamed protein product [Paramecium primaurelia]|uniref:Uncharacterized protein n=1 Tax=Paramecium primaurelia TaxID=5886 RepID=A0A8S1QRD6_PARPR|nr:unnamed protein product [Paramecium primaurelia]
MSRDLYNLPKYKCLSCIQSYFYDQKKERCLERKQYDESKGLYYDDIKNIRVTKCGDQNQSQ